MSTEDNKAIVGRWFTEFWGKDFNPAVIDELAAPDIRFEYSLHGPCRGRDEVREFATTFRAAFPDLELLGHRGPYRRGRLRRRPVGGWRHPHRRRVRRTCPSARCRRRTGKTMRFTGITVLKVEDGLITEELGLDDGVTVLQQLGLIKAA